MAAPTLVLGPDRDGRVLVMAGDRVVGFGPDVEARDALECLACSDAVIRPGAVNAHTHMYSGLAPMCMPTLAEKPRTFLRILERVWWRLDRALDEASLHAAARFYIAGALMAGTTTLVDHHESPGFIESSLDVLADACEALGMRAVLCYGATERNHGLEEADRGLEACRRFLRCGATPLVRGVVGLHASFTVSDDTVQKAGALCRDLGTVMHVHLAEDAADVQDARDRGWPGPLERLLDLGALPPGSLLAHGVHLDAVQVDRATEGGCWFIQNPRSNAGNGVGYPRALGVTGRVALGTDGYPADMAEEEVVLFREGRAHGEADEVLRRRPAAGWALASERFDMPLAPLAPGAAADAVALGEEGVRHVVVGGRAVVKDGRLLTADREEVRAEAAREAARLRERMKTL